MPPTIYDLPAEVLRLILTIVQSNARRDRSGAFFSAITTCRLWSEICVSLLWTDISLSGTRLLKFASTEIPQSSSILVRSLSIKVPVHSSTEWILFKGDPPLKRSFHQDEATTLPDPYAEQDVKNALELLPPKLGAMAHLESFSIIVPFAQNRMTCFLINRRSILAILQAVPSSVLHLELDINYPGHSNRREISNTDLCPVLRAMMNRLVNLRLRVDRLCPNLFAPVSKPIEAMTSISHSEVARQTIIINTIPELGRVAHFWPCIGLDALPIRYPRFVGDHPSDIDQYSTSEDQLDVLLSHAQDAFQGSNSPAATRLSIFSDYAWPQVPGDNRDMVYGAINEFTIAPKQKLRKFPCFLAEQDHKSFLRYIDTDGGPRDICGNFKDILEVAEGRIWIETEDGHRLPNEYYEAEPRFQATPLRATTIEKFPPITPRGSAGLSSKRKSVLDIRSYMCKNWMTW